jgi:hypothetical protein
MSRIRSRLKVPPVANGVSSMATVMGRVSREVMEIITSKVGEPGERRQMSEEVEGDAEKVGGGESSLTVNLIESKPRCRVRESAQSFPT